MEFDVDVEVNWLVNDTCNFSCEYCYPSARKNQFTGLKDPQAIVDAFDRTGLRWLIYLTGGEPFLMPNFVELCQGLTKNHIISLNSNLAHRDVHRFIETVSPDRVRCVHCSIHMAERERRGKVDDFIDKYQRLQKAGFYVFGSYVLYPPLMARFEQDYATLKSHGIIARPKLFRGVYNPWHRYVPRRFWPRLRRFDRTYPAALTARQKEQILSWMKRSQEEGKFQVEGDDHDSNMRLSDVSQDGRFIDGLPCFKDRMCRAGVDFVRMMPQGDMFRCYHDSTPMGNLFNGTFRRFDNSRPCPAKACGCPYIGFKHVVKDADGTLSS